MKCKVPVCARLALWLPPSLDAVSIQHFVIAYDWDMLERRLRHEQPVERIAVISGQARLHVRVLDGDWQNSRGCSMEYAYAKGKGIPITFVSGKGE